MEEAELARRAAAGDVDAFTCLVRLHEADVRRFLDRVTMGRGGDDIAQEAFLKAWRRRAAWWGGSYRAWLMRIAWTSFLDTHRVTTRRAAREDAAFAMADSSAVDADTRIDLCRALATLSERERAAAQLCLGEGFSHGEAAEILAMPLGTLKSTVLRARARLAMVLGTAG